jgi:hypothetical protein
MLEQFKDVSIDASIGYIWGKFNLTPFEEDFCHNNETHVKNLGELAADKEILT